MSRILELTSIKTTRKFLLAFIVVFLTMSAAQAAPNIVTTYQDAKGWKLKVDGKDTYVKGMVWGYSPVPWEAIKVKLGACEVGAQADTLELQQNVEANLCRNQSILENL